MHNPFWEKKKKKKKKKKGGKSKSPGKKKKKWIFISFILLSSLDLCFNLEFHQIIFN